MKLQILCEYLGGSFSYGLDNALSDKDYRGTYIVDNLADIIDPDHYFATGCGVVDEDPTKETADKVYFEIRHFLHLLKKGNTQCVEMMFNEQWTKISPLFTDIIKQRKLLLDPVRLYRMADGYSDNEYHLAIGSRTGKLGGKRQTTVDKLGFSPKNFVNLFRLLYSAEYFFETGKFPVNLKGTFIHPQLAELKNYPERFTLLRLHEMFRDGKAAFEKSWARNQEKICAEYKFDDRVATDLMFECYKDTLIKIGHITTLRQIKAYFA